LLEVSYPPSTNVLDRNSRYNRWNVRVSGQELEKNIIKSYPQIGSLVDLKVLRRGKSNRVIELQIIGEKETVVVQGLRVRWVLNLKDTLFSSTANMTLPAGCLTLCSAGAAGDTESDYAR